MIDYNKLKQIFPQGLPDPDTFFAHREVSDVMGISYATLRRETGYRTTNYGAWNRFAAIYAAETADVIVNSINLVAPVPNSLEFGKTGQLNIRVMPDNATNKAVTYTPVDPSIISVSSTGLITAKSKAGSSVINIASVDGGAFTTAYVTVKAPSTEV